MTFTPKERELLFGPTPQVFEYKSKVKVDITDPRTGQFGTTQYLRNIAQNQRLISRNQRGEAASALDWAADKIDELERQLIELDNWYDPLCAGEAPPPKSIVFTDEEIRDLVKKILTGQQEDQ